jgi:putative drug exporter of the RND superfamily
MNETVPTPPGKSDDTEDTQNTENEVKRPRAAKLARRFALPIVLFWVLAAVLTNVLVPSIEENTKANAKALVPRDSPSSQAALVQGSAFRESDYTSAVVIFFETEGRKLGDQDHQYYNELVRRLRSDRQHVQSLLDLWGKPVTKSGQQSADGEAATLTVRPAGDTGDATSSRSIEAIRDIVAKAPKPHGLNTYVTGPAALNTDTLAAADDSMFTLTIVSVLVIIVMLLLAYRSVARALIPLVGVLVILATARGVVSFLVGLHVLGISSFAMNMLVALVLGVATDYGIFFIGRYNEARRAGQDKESAYYTSVANTSHVILGSGRIDALPKPHQAELLPHPRPALLCGDGRRRRRRADPRSRDARAGRQDQMVAANQPDEPDVAQARDRYRPVAGGDDLHRRSCRSAVRHESGHLQGEL